VGIDDSVEGATATSGAADTSAEGEVTGGEMAAAGAAAGVLAATVLLAVLDTVGRVVGAVVFAAVPLNPLEAVTGAHFLVTPDGGDGAALATAGAVGAVDFAAAGAALFAAIGGELVCDPPPPVACAAYNVISTLSCAGEKRV